MFRGHSRYDAILSPFRIAAASKDVTVKCRLLFISAPIAIGQPQGILAFQTRRPVLNISNHRAAVLNHQLFSMKDEQQKLTTASQQPVTIAGDVPTVESSILPAKRDSPVAVSAEKEVKRSTGEDDVLCIKLEHATATLPTRGSALAAGYDLSASEAAVIPKGGRAVVSTGLSISVPLGCYGRVAPRSGLAVKKGIDVGAGVIDSDYRGIVGVVLFNFGEEDINIAPGDRIAQLIIERIATPRVVEVVSLDETDRGAAGFGSTGVATTN